MVGQQVYWKDDDIVFLGIMMFFRKEKICKNDQEDS